jgi:uncharacterized iron-regulated membrane protein
MPRRPGGARHQPAAGRGHRHPRKVEPGYSITLPTTADGVFTIAVFADDPRNDATLHVDQYTGKVWPMCAGRYSPWPAPPRSA